MSEALNDSRVGKIGVFQPVSGRRPIPETVQDRTKVVIEH